MAVSKSALGQTYLTSAAEKHAEALTKIAVEAFGDGKTPGFVYAKRPTIRDRSKIRTHAKGDPFEEALYTVIFLAMDEAGNPLFSLEDKQALKVTIDADVIEALAYRINNGLSYEAVKKN